MTKKKFDLDSITNELEGASLFFAKKATPPPVPQPEKPQVEKANPLSDSPFFEKQSNPLPSETPTEKELVKPKRISKEKSNIRDTTTPRNHDTVTPRHHDTKQSTIHAGMIALVRKAVREFGKEAATHRFTDTEKKEISDLIYTYKNRGIKTSENVITRIAVNYIVEDYKENGENSVLHKILEALNE